VKAVICPKYGSADLLQLVEVAKPVPEDDEVRIRIHVATVTPGDCELRKFKFPAWLWLPLRLYVGVRKPRRPILGMELAGEIESVGKDVTRFEKNDRVVASAGLLLGGHAEYVCLPESCAMAKLPAGVAYEQAAPLPVGGANALYFLRKAEIQKGEKVLVNGAGGTIGSFGVQLAKYYGAEVTAVDRTEKLEMLRAIGADHVIDYTKQHFSENGETYDVILDVIFKSSFSRSLKSLAENGRLLLANPRFSLLFRGPWTSRTTSKTVFVVPASESSEDLRFLAELIAAGEIKPFIGRRYSLEQMAEAQTHVESGLKQGHVIITSGQSSTQQAR
jgi:NADPH:quinone reductase-like Zn-dependent oxidoreductase